MNWTAFSDFLRTRAQELLGTDLNQIRYTNIGMTYSLSIAVILVAVVTLVRFWLTSRRHHREHSGHVIEQRFQRGSWSQAFYNFPKLLLGLALAVLLVAMADPYLTATEEIAGDMESRVRIDLVDTSLSMAWEFPGTGKSGARWRVRRISSFSRCGAPRTTGCRCGCSRRFPTWWTTLSSTTSSTTSR